MKHRVYKNLSLFSGAMGFDIGLELSGRFETVAAIEFDKACCETIRKNRDAGRIGSKNMRVYEGDIRHIDPHEVMNTLSLTRGELDLITAGPPCQAFSTSGKRRSVEDPRGTLLWRTIDYIETFQPKTFVIENVRGLLSAALRHRPINMRPEKGGPPLEDDELPGSVMKRFLEDVRARLGSSYRMDVFEVNAVNYGAPQIRERAIFIGNRLGAQMEFPAPTHGPGQIPFRTLGDALRNLRHRKDDVLMDFSPRKKRYLAMIPPGGNWRSLPEQLQRESMGRAYLAKGGRSGWWRRLSSDLPSPTIVTMPNHSSTALTHPEEVRALTVRECASIQEFPADWELVGTPMEQYAQVGNAVPTRLGKVTGETLAEALDNGRLESVDGLNVYRIVYLRSHVRTRKWFSGGENFVWKDGKDNMGAVYSPPVTERKVREFISAAAE